VARCTESSVHRMTWRNWIKSWNISRAEMCRDIFGIFHIVFNKNQYLTRMNK
jgi:hypothetical protein